MALLTKLKKTGKVDSSNGESVPPPPLGPDLHECHQLSSLPGANYHVNVSVCCSISL